MSQIARVVLFGKTSLNNTSRAVSCSVSQFLRTDIAAETTFGLIAWVCMMVRCADIFSSIVYDLTNLFIIMAGALSSVNRSFV